MKEEAAAPFFHPFHEIVNSGGGSAAEVKKAKATGKSCVCII